MKPSKYAQQLEALDEHIGLAVPADLKAKIFLMAARKRLPASHLIREVLQSYTSQNAA
jgi:hypothetical protein